MSEAIAHVGKLLDDYVRPDDGTRIVICFHQKATRAAAWLWAACARRGTMPESILFEVEDARTSAALSDAIDAAKSFPQTRRVVVIVVEPAGPSFAKLLDERSGSGPDKLAIFRVSALTT